MGLTKAQNRRLKDRSLSKEERTNVALLILNETCTFEKVLEQLDAGKTVEDLMKEKSE